MKVEDSRHKFHYHTCIINEAHNDTVYYYFRVNDTPVLDYYYHSVSEGHMFQMKTMRDWGVTVIICMELTHYNVLKYIFLCGNDLKLLYLANN
jgi:hypothetical protein